MEIEDEIQKVFPQYRARPRPMVREGVTEKEIQKEMQGLSLSLRLDKSMSKTDLKLDRPLIKDMKRGRGRSLEIWGETRRYPVAERKKFFRRLLGMLK